MTNKASIRNDIEYIKKYFKSEGISTIIPIFLFHHPEYSLYRVRLTNALQGRVADEDILNKLENLKNTYEYNKR